MPPNSLEPDGRVVVELDAHWHKMFTLLMWKLARDTPVIITLEDLRAYQAAFNAGEAVLLTRGVGPALEFKFLTRDEAVAYAAYENENFKGTA